MCNIPPLPRINDSIMFIAHSMEKEVIALLEEENVQNSFHKKLCMDNLKNVESITREFKGFEVTIKFKIFDIKIFKGSSRIIPKTENPFMDWKEPC